ncbi:hypothetical protein RJ640_019314 [Escallonia rubra]|uniref:Reverse transcriptase zinc-binding domain-containing protein n=1 Tax=Escallonia rubra TaxID=112253 RepID=A0AA88RAQ4_9ASTE|nr:hypothetical protein RJ640_019314 [Escallonia rubra]
MPTPRYNEECFICLDLQPEASVFYVSMGSFLSTSNEMHELSKGLRVSGFRCGLGLGHLGISWVLALEEVLEIEVKLGHLLLCMAEVLEPLLHFFGTFTFSVGYAKRYEHGKEDEKCCQLPHLHLYLYRDRERVLRLERSPSPLHLDSLSWTPNVASAWEAISQYGYQLLWRNGVRTKDILRKWNYQIDDLCPLCKSEDESKNHLFWDSAFSQSTSSSTVAMSEIQDHVSYRKNLQSYAVAKWKDNLFTLGLAKWS